jgi:hypothetical protein
MGRVYRCPLANERENSNAIGLLMYRIDTTMLHRRENPLDRMTCRKLLQYEPNLRLRVCLVHIYLLVS